MWVLRVNYRMFIYRMIVLLALVIVMAGWILNFAPGLLSYALIALTLGVRHGLDADHIVAIDNITRKLAVEKKPSITTGLYFALGHSTVVFILTVILILGVMNSHVLYSKLSTFGNQIGGLISISFLCMTMVINLLAFKNIRHSPQINNPNFIFKLANKYLFNLIDRPHKMFFVGFLFGLGFDTATEIGLLALAAASILNGINPGLILLLPVIFACGMIFTDTLNSVFMSSIYRLVEHNSHKSYQYNYVILGFATLSTLVVIIIEVVGYLNAQVPHSNLLFWLSNGLNDNMWLFGASITSVFILLGIGILVKSVRLSKSSSY